MPSKKMTIEEIEEQMDKLKRELVATRNPKIREELYRLAHELGKLEKESSD
jgi:hypothetical protein